MAINTIFDVNYFDSPAFSNARGYTDMYFNSPGFKNERQTISRDEVLRAKNMGFQVENMFTPHMGQIYGTPQIIGNIRRVFNNQTESDSDLRSRLNATPTNELSVSDLNFLQNKNSGIDTSPSNSITTNTGSVPGQAINDFSTINTQQKQNRLSTSFLKQLYGRL